MAASEDKSVRVRARYIKAWNETMTTIWQDRINRLGVFESPRRASRTGLPHLIDTLRYFPVQHDGMYMELTLKHAFVQYGLFQDLGVGREKARGNSGDIGSTTQSGKPRKFRQRRKWFSTKYYSSVMNLKDFLAESIGHEFVGIVADTLKVLLIVFALTSCKVQQPVPTAHHKDSVRVEYRLDSVYLYERDSIYVDRFRANDTVYLTTTKYLTRYKDVWREVHDTIAVCTTDTIVAQVPYVPGYYKRTARGFWVLLVVLLLIAAIKAIKIYLRIN